MSEFPALVFFHWAKISHKNRFCTVASCKTFKQCINLLLFANIQTDNKYALLKTPKSTLVKINKIF